jgi:hypothetical protein
MARPSAEVAVVAVAELLLAAEEGAVSLVPPYAVDEVVLVEGSEEEPVEDGAVASHLRSMATSPKPLLLPLLQLQPVPDPLGQRPSPRQMAQASKRLLLPSLVKRLQLQRNRLLLLL